MRHLVRIEGTKLDDASGGLKAPGDKVSYATWSI